MTNQTIRKLVEQSSEKAVALIALLTLGMAAIDPAAATYYLTDGNAAATAGVFAGTAAVGGATAAGVATAGATAGAVIATGGAALVVAGAAAA